MLFYVILFCSMYFLCSVYIYVVLCIVCFVSFSVFFCVYMCTEQLPSGGYPIAVNIYHIIAQHGLKEGDALSSLLFNFGLQSAVINVHETQAELEMNVRHQLLRHPILI